MYRWQLISQWIWQLKIMVLTKTCQYSSINKLEFKGVRLVEKFFHHGVTSSVKTAAEQHNCECGTRTICELMLLLLGKDAADPCVCLTCGCWWYICKDLQGAVLQLFIQSPDGQGVRLCKDLSETQSRIVSVVLWLWSSLISSCQWVGCGALAPWPEKVSAEAFWEVCLEDVESRTW